jgi:hypothetical protein
MGTRMLIELNHTEVRNLAKVLRERVGRDVKHSLIVAAIARCVGLQADAIMHALKDTPTARLKLDDRAISALASDLTRIGGKLVEAKDVMADIGRGDPNAADQVVFTFRGVGDDLRMFVGDPADEPVELRFEEWQLALLGTVIGDPKHKYDRTLFDGFVYRIKGRLPGKRAASNYSFREFVSVDIAELSPEEAPISCVWSPGVERRAYVNRPFKSNNGIFREGRKSVDALVCVPALEEGSASGMRGRHLSAGRATST